MADLKKVFVLGFFDGVHVGHRYLLQAAREYALLLGGSCVVLTFGDDFLKNVGRDQKEIYTLSEKKKLLGKLGFKSVSILDDNKDLLSLSADEFLDIIEKKAPSAVFAGTDFCYGAGAKGNMIQLMERFEDSKVTSSFSINLQKNNGVKISSRDIRLLISAGKIKEANVLLGEPFFVSGDVTEGRKEGRKLGLPTANITPDQVKLLPRDGVYATVTTIGRKAYHSVTNVGAHPTYNDDRKNVETYVIGFNGDLYGKSIKISFYAPIRDIRKFDTKEELAIQIESDIAFALKYFENTEGGK